MDFAEHNLSPVQQEFLAYWRQKAGDQIAPRRRDLDVLDVPKLMPHVIIFDVLSDPLDFRYRLVGTTVREMSRNDYTGLKLSEIDGRGPGSKVWSMLDQVRENQKPAFYAVEYMGPKRDFRKLDDLFLPLVDDRLETDMIMIVTSYQRKPRTMA